MTIKALLNVVTKAQDIREASWLYEPPGYTWSDNESITKAFEVSKIVPTETEKEIASFLMSQAWNEVQDWAKAI